MTEHDRRFEDAAAAYLLGALDADEAVAFETHLEDCSACRAEVTDLKAAADAIPHGVMQFKAPPALEDRIMATVRSEAALLRSAAPNAVVPPATSDRSASRRSWLPQWLGRPGFALAATLLVLAVGALGGATLLDGSDQRTVTAAMAPQGSKVEMIVREGSDHATLTGSGLPEAGKGRVYQVWLRSGENAPVPTDALFSVSSRGTASVDVPGDLADVDDVLVTSEPDGGSVSPTRNPIIAVKTA